MVPGGQRDIAQPVRQSGTVGALQQAVVVPTCRRRVGELGLVCTVDMPLARDCLIDQPAVELSRSAVGTPVPRNVELIWFHWCHRHLQLSGHACRSDIQRDNATRFHRSRFLHLAAGAVTLQAVTRVASALDYPTRPVRLLVGFAAGPTDIVARLEGLWVGRAHSRLEDPQGESPHLRSRTYRLTVVSSCNDWVALGVRRLPTARLAAGKGPPQTTDCAP
jgi:hypothetical protein